MDALVLEIVSYAEAASAVRFVRQAVFQQEQQIDPALDFDGLDELAQHVVAYNNTDPIGTARIRPLNDRSAKLERVAVLSAYRGRGVGKALTEAAIEFLRQQKFVEIRLNAQLHSKLFYQKLGFEPRGEEFEEAGIPHIQMWRALQ
ncbi:GNAT family N-acetyltransferase [Thermocoleostomius sinensis]|jgi:predicted GNAT family N-acyltransferase|uniref:GNAT family N-acetyltransferase n=1 Tax=Thermocoleostomius sinensis A174 TaxID=2016057 RepID=A0A9E9CBI2_9CYAN|nr:GNAT family N-acetyltransferase [Thermocoleostomius sinensis]WAL62402.1 GNAT family N-acetyltransferase [Thermocoleostomius sinensis A174]